MNTEWFRSLSRRTLDLWLAHSPTENGLFHPAFDRTWQRLSSEVTLVSQGRLIHNFCTGWELFGEPAFLAAATRGARALNGCFLDRDEGGWYYACSPDGHVTDSGKDLYGHAFVILGLAHLARLTGDGHWRELATNTVDLALSRFRDRRGGWTWHRQRDFTPTAETRRSQNPLMHLFEALLELAPSAPAALEKAREIYCFIDSHLLRDDGLLPEYFDEAWQELPEANGGRISIGHAYEWAFLLSRATAAGMPDQLLAPAQRLLAFGTTVGIDPADGGVYSWARPDGAALPPAKGWWEQCEAIRAMLHFRQVHRQSLLTAPLTRLQVFAETTFVDREYGGWYLEPPQCLDKGNSWKVDYHVLGMCAEARRLEQEREPSR